MVIIQFIYLIAETEIILYPWTQRDLTRVCESNQSQALPFLTDDFPTG